jgi:hypothetical protein
MKDILVTIFVIIITLIIISAIGIVAGFISIFVCFIIESFMKRRCKHCGQFSLIPVDTPVGLKIMKDEGWYDHDTKNT